MGYSSQLFDAACGARWPIEAPLLSSRLARLGAHPHAPQVARGSSNHDREHAARPGVGALFIPPPGVSSSPFASIVSRVSVYDRLPFVPEHPARSTGTRNRSTALGFAGHRRRSSASRESRRPRSRVAPVRPTYISCDRTVPRPPDAPSESDADSTRTTARRAPPVRRAARPGERCNRQVCARITRAARCRFR